MLLGQVRALSVRASRRGPPLRVEEALAIAGVGLAGDVHADSASPRQLLLAGVSVYEAFALPDQALRENLLLECDTASLASGTVLQIGAEARIRLMFDCEACGQLDLQRPGLAHALGKRRGMLARVIAGGPIRQGDAVVMTSETLPAWPDDWRERVAKVLDAVPPGAVIEYARLAHVAGIQASYCRAFPRLLAKLGAQYAARTAPARMSGSLPRWDGFSLFERA